MKKELLSTNPKEEQLYWRGISLYDYGRSELIDIINHLLYEIDRLKEDKQQLYKLLEK